MKITRCYRAARKLAAKAGSDLLALSYHETYKLPVIVTRASDNYGPPSIPREAYPTHDLQRSNALENKPLPVYGDGMQIRDWLYVEDHCRAILAVLENGRDGEIYNVGRNRSLANKLVIERLLTITGKPTSLIEYVTDRPGHDRPYALSNEKLHRETGWISRRDGEIERVETKRAVRLQCKAL
jgi:dTDP-glucose 4,6-dehydratase